MKKITLLVVFGLLAGNALQAQKNYYQILVYHFQNYLQEQQLDTFLSTALVPHLHNTGHKAIGIFTPLTNDTAADKKIVVLLTFRSLTEAASWNKLFIASGIEQQKTPAFWNAPHDAPAYSRRESILIEAWDGAPTLQIPKLSSPLAQHVYELRSYESPSEKYYRSKVHMFNEGGEIQLFARLGFNAVFYGDVIAGSRMPNLMYLTCFENMEARNAHWKAFSDSPEWKKLISLKEYENNVNKADIILMKATSYSDY